MTTPGPDLLRRLGYLVANPREDLEVELKGWLDLQDANQAGNLAKSIIALANHGGGFVLIGFSKTKSGIQPDPNRPSSIAGYDNDAVNSIVQKYAEPTFHCSVQAVTPEGGGPPHPIIIVPGGHKAPIRSKRESPDGKSIKINVYYIRRPGPASESPQSGREWDELVRRCIVNARDELVEAVRIVFLAAAGAPFGQLLGNAGASKSLEKELDDWIDESEDAYRKKDH